MNNAKPNPWPWMILGTFTLFFAGTVGLIVMACSQKTDLVSKDYYEQELRYQAQIDNADRARHLAVQPQVSFDAAQRAIVIHLPTIPARPITLGTICLYRPSAAGLDRKLPLNLDSSGLQKVDASQLAPGPWKVRVSWNSGGEGYFVDQRVVVKAAAS